MSSRCATATTTATSRVTSRRTRMGDGVLVLVATPIGNLADLSPRAVSELARADVIACEDTRKAGKLLEHAGVRPPGYLVVNDHTEANRIPDVLSRLGRGERVV